MSVVPTRLMRPVWLTGHNRTNQGRTKDEPSRSGRLLTDMQNLYDDSGSRSPSMVSHGHTYI